MSFTTEAARWRALTVRDTSANGHFVYSVKSTNVYCRPACPARLARRANVGFYRTPAEAAAAGFRPCKRCKPDTEVIDDPQEKAVNKACALIESALEEEDPKSFKLQDLAKNVGLTPRYFHKIFKDKTGLTPKEYAKAKKQALQPATVNEQADQECTLLDSWDFGEFDLNNLLDLDTDPSLSMDPMTSTFDTTDPTLSTMFGQLIDVNIQPSVWNDYSASNSLVPGFDYDKQFGAGFPTIHNVTDGLDEWSRITVMGSDENSLDAVLAAIVNAPPIALPQHDADHQAMSCI
ncbi:metal binding domain of Ada-domain-containing protein [Lophiotrema nucula]|uniref:Metal binding domain of Ada-domain-containing protein n=1 Tax=Lophiotrema nucula TaxID=690887 RepID=A0A6A5ZF78_9PLEO|nr:metal binding domain of Ada-domain-containing protein [Lophiotrema nucula]